ncbi:MAG: iron ABC transporter substrate-binding protein [Bacteroidales bacterium]|nr:iron ABC transporter substrate-binding protein [Bacteroidales bacterium]
MKYDRYILFSITTVILFISCRNPSRPDRDECVVVKDMLGREVKVPENIERIVGLRAGALRLLVYMDGADKVVGIEEAEKRGVRPYTIAHPELMELPLIGPSMGGDAELILKAQPDVIFITYTTKGDADDLQKKTHIPVVAIECPELGTARDTLYDSFRLIGKILHKEKRADSLISYIENSIDDLNIRSTGFPVEKKPSVYIGGVPYSGAHGICSTQPFYPPFLFLHANNVASEIDRRLVSHVKGTYIDKEKLISWNPDVLFIDASGLSLVKQDLAKNSPLNSSLKAIQNNAVHILLPYNNYAINYELVLINAWYTGKVLYPSGFANVKISQKANEILEVFLGKSIYKEINIISPGLQPVDQNEF